jgi:hypothetical protein
MLSKKSWVSDHKSFDTFLFRIENSWTVYQNGVQSSKPFHTEQVVEVKLSWYQINIPRCVVGVKDNVDVETHLHQKGQGLHHVDEACQDRYKRNWVFGLAKNKPIKSLDVVVFVDLFSQKK